MSTTIRIPLRLVTDLLGLPQGTVLGTAYSHLGLGELILQATLPPTETAGDNQPVQLMRMTGYSGDRPDVEWEKE